MERGRSSRILRGQCRRRTWRSCVGPTLRSREGTGTRSTIWPPLSSSLTSPTDSWTRSFSEVATTRLLFLRSEEHTSELQSHSDLVCRLLLEKKKKTPHQPPTEQHKPKRTSRTK